MQIRSNKKNMFFSCNLDEHVWVGRSDLKRKKKYKYTVHEAANLLWFDVNSHEPLVNTNDSPYFSLFE